MPQLCFGCIYFDKSIYCFGKSFIKEFDLYKNRFRELTQMRNRIYDYCNSVVFNRNILISTDKKRHIFLYSIDIDSFSEIPYNFAKSKKILINAEGKLFIIECTGWIYESEDEYNWKQIGKSIIEIDPKQVNCSYNKGGIYISILYNDKYRYYFKFDLNRKALIEIAFYSENLSLQRSGDRFETLNYNDNIYELSPNHTAAYIDREDSLRSIGDKLIRLNNRFKYDPKFLQAWVSKGEILSNLGIYPEAIEYCNKSIKNYPEYTYAYIYKGFILQKLGRHLEALKYYSQAIERDCYYVDAYFNKGNALQELGENLEAIKYYNEAIKLAPCNHNYYFNKGKAFMNLGSNIEAIECFSKVLKLKPDNAIAYNNIGEALYNLERNIKAIECYDEAIRLKIDEPLFYRNRANALTKLGKQIEALQDLNKADDLMKSKQIGE